eukprot:m.19450 g.19450  ORF g.19450 m.19450 type:complete len:1357 (+) comp5933_c0_seq2:89-4159(+)
MFKSFRSVFGSGGSRSRSNSGNSAHACNPSGPPHDANVIVQELGSVGLVAGATVLAYAPGQDLLAIGSRTGTIQIIGQDGVTETWSSPLEEDEIIELAFVPNEGRLVVAHKPNRLRLWNIRCSPPQLQQTLELARKEICKLAVPLESKWLYVGTAGGDILFVHNNTFSRSTYIIPWNKSVTDGMRPGTVVAIEENPADSGELLLAYSKGTVVVWDLEKKCVRHRLDTRQQGTQTMSAAWSSDGKVALIGLANGNVLRWSPGHSGDPDVLGTPCCGTAEPVTNLHVLPVKQGDVVVHTGGETPLTSFENTVHWSLGSSNQSMLEFPSAVRDIVCVSNTPQGHERGAMVVLLEDGIAVVDLTDATRLGLPSRLRVHVSPLCCSKSVCLQQGRGLLSALGQAAQKRGQQGGRGLWPLKGGTVPLGQRSGHGDVAVFTGHDDGSVRVWDAAGHPDDWFLVYTLTLPPAVRQLLQQDDGEARQPRVHHLEFAEATGRLAVSYGLGVVAIYSLSTDQGTTTVKVASVPLLVHPDTLPEAEAVSTDDPSVADDDDSSAAATHAAASPGASHTSTPEPEPLPAASPLPGVADAASSSGSPVPAPPATAAGASGAEPDPKLATLLSRGYRQDAAVDALAQANGNINEACMLLCNADLEGKDVRAKPPRLDLAGAAMGESSTDDPELDTSKDQDVPEPSVCVANQEPQSKSRSASNIASSSASQQVSPRASPGVPRQPPPPPQLPAEFDLKQLPGLQVTHCFLSQLQVESGLREFVDHVTCLALREDTLAWGNAFGVCAAVMADPGPPLTMGLSHAQLVALEDAKQHHTSEETLRGLELSADTGRITSLVLTAATPEGALCEQRPAVFFSPKVCVGTSTGQVYFVNLRDIARPQASSLLGWCKDVGAKNKAVYKLHLLNEETDFTDRYFKASAYAALHNAPRDGSAAAEPDTDSGQAEADAGSEPVPDAEHEAPFVAQETAAEPTHDEDDHEASLVVFKKFKSRLAQCSNTDEVDLLGARIKAAVDAQLLTGEQILALRDLYRLHRQHVCEASGSPTQAPADGAAAASSKKEDRAAGSDASPVARRRAAVEQAQWEKHQAARLLVLTPCSVCSIPCNGAPRQRTLTKTLKNIRLFHGFVVCLGGQQLFLAVSDKGKAVVFRASDLDQCSEVDLRLPRGFRAARSLSVSDFGLVLCTTQSQGLRAAKLVDMNAPSHRPSAPASSAADDKPAGASAVGDDSNDKAEQPPPPGKLFVEGRKHTQKARGGGIMTKLFGGGTMGPSEREQLLGAHVDARDSSYDATRTTHPGGAVDPNNPAEKLRLKAMERADKIKQIEDTSAQMANDAENFHSAAQQLAERFANKKWYEL